MASTSIRFLPTVLILTAFLLPNVQTTAAIRHLLQTNSRSPTSFFKGLLPPLSSIISSISPKAPSNLPSLSQGSLPPLSSIISALSPQASNLPSLSQGSLPPLSTIISAISPMASKLPSSSQGSLPRVPGRPATPAAIGRVARPPPAATPSPTKPSTIPAVPTARPTLPGLSAPPARKRP